MIRTLTYSECRKYLRFSVVLLLILLSSSCNRNHTLLEQVKSSYSGIHFANTIIENDSINQLDNGNIFNGGGAGIGDFNNDGQQDIYFTSSLGSNKLYLNNGDFKFQDVTEESGVKGDGKWCRGVAVVDINNDGYQDIYVSATIKKDAIQRKNLLYVNQGNNNSNVPTFKDMAAEYGLADDSHTTQAAFFDYDNDGDIDVYLAVNEINDRNSPYIFRPVLKNNNTGSSGRLYRNDFDSLKGHPVFTDVSAESGIRAEGFGNQASITDINLDGWKDIYVTNDFISPDLMWINNKNGTFSEKLSSVFRHTSNSAMGNDVGDINNDGLQDILALDMNPEDNYRKKMMLLPSSYQFFQNSDQFGYVYQYVRNTLQLNRGKVPGPDSSGMPVFSEISFYAGIDGTDWSWTPLLADFDNDGYRDLFIANGFPRDITDRDFGMFRAKAWLTTPKADILKQIPEVKIHNYLFRNNGNLKFSDKSQHWGLSTPTFSNGAAYADFDNDGDLDLIINNINDEASLYRNNSIEINPDNSRFLTVRLQGDSRNISGLGTWIEIWYSKGRHQIWESSPYRGYISTVENAAHFGLGNVTSVDSVVVKWQNGKFQIFRNIATGQMLNVNVKDAVLSYSWDQKKPMTKSLFNDITASSGIKYVHRETDFIDFNIQKLLPHKFSEYDPALAAGDIDGDGLDDLITGSSSNNSAQIFTQKPDGTFAQKPLLPGLDFTAKKWDDMGILLFDADGDNDPDLYIASGGFENDPGSNAYTDHFYINDGKGKFSENIGALPLNMTSKACVRATDFDRDGDPDLFVSGRVDPWNYPRPVSSFIYRNDSEHGKVKFTDITKEAAPALVNSGMVCDALFSDFNNDGWPDLILAGEWMPLTFLENEKGTFKNITDITGLSSCSGWWNTLCPGDFDNDGDIDYIAGNLGLNSFYRADSKHPVSIYSGDFDNNGSYDAFPSLFLVTSQTDSTKKDYPVFGRDDAVKQMISLRSRFQNYKSFASATTDQLFSKEQLAKAQINKANVLSSSYIRNDGKNKFTIIPLPAEAQFSVLNGIVAGDFDDDGNLDVLINGNDYGTDVLAGRYDALNGLLISGDGKGGFVARSMTESGIYIPGNGKALVSLRSGKGKYLVGAAQNNGPLKIFELENNLKTYAIKPGETSAMIELKNGSQRREEFYYGSSNLSQSARYLTAGKNTKKAIITNSSGEKRILDF
jgi:hypothetical protein